MKQQVVCSLQVETFFNLGKGASDNVKCCCQEQRVVHGMVQHWRRQIVYTNLQRNNSSSFNAILSYTISIKRANERVSTYKLHVFDVSFSFIPKYVYKKEKKHYFLFILPPSTTTDHHHHTTTTNKLLLLKYYYY